MAIRRRGSVRARPSGGCPPSVSPGQPSARARARRRGSVPVRPALLVGAGVDVADHLPPGPAERRDVLGGRGERVEVVDVGLDAQVQGAGELPLPGGPDPRLPPPADRGAGGRPGRRGAMRRDPMRRGGGRSGRRGRRGDGWAVSDCGRGAAAGASAMAVTPSQIAVATATPTVAGMRERPAFTGRPPPCAATTARRSRAAGRRGR